MEKLKGENFIIAIAALSGLLIASNLYILIPLGEYLSKSYNFSNSELSVCSSAFSTSYALGFLFWGVLANRFGNKRVITSGLLTLAIVTALFALNIDRKSFILFRALQGISAASFAPAMLSLFSTKLEGNKKVTTIGILSSTFLIAGIIGQVLGSYIVKSYDLSTLLIILAIGYLFSYITLYLALPKDRKRGRELNLLEHFKHLPRCLGNKRLIPYYLVSLTLLLAFVGLYTALNQILKANSISPAEMMQVRILGIMGMLASPFAPFISAKLGSKKTLSFALLLSFIAALMLATRSSFITLVLWTNIFNMGIALAGPLIVNRIGEIAGENRNIAVSLYTFILFIGASSGSFLSIRLSSLLSGGKIILCYGFILLASSLIIPFFIKEEKCEAAVME